MELKAVPATALPVREMQVPNSLKVQGKGADKDPAAVRKAARDFEAVFVGMMLKSMRDTVGKETLTGGGRGEETFRSLLDQEYATQASRTGSIGLASMIERELTRSTKGGDSAD